MNPKSAAETLVVHAGVHPEPRSGAVMTPIFQTSTFVQKEPGVHSGWDYSRAGNPTRDALEEALAVIEGAKHSLSFASGLAAEQAIIQTLNPGDRVLVSDDVYGGTGRLFRKLFAKYGIDFVFLDMTRLDLVEKECTPKTKLLWMETPTNPTMKIVDIEALCKIAKKVKAISVVDNTFASPMLQKPLELGADIAIYSTTKYIGGHSDLIGGALTMNRSDLYESLKFIQFAAGSVPSPFECFLLLRSIKTLAVRMKQHCSNAMILAAELEKHPKVARVFYPGLKSHPQHELAKKQMVGGFSGMISFQMKGDYQDVLTFLSRLKLFTLAESLGGVESLVNHPEKMTHASVPPDLRAQLGIDSQLLRLSVGIENAQDLVADVLGALG